MDLAPIERDTNPTELGGPDAAAAPSASRIGATRQIATLVALCTLFFLPGVLQDSHYSLGPSLLKSLLFGAILAAAVGGIIVAGQKSERATLFLRVGALFLLVIIVVRLTHGIAQGYANAAEVIEVFVPQVTALVGIAAAWYSRQRPEWQTMLSASRGFMAGIVGAVVGAAMLIVVQPLTFSSTMYVLLESAGRGLVVSLVVLLAAFVLFGFSRDPRAEQAAHQEPDSQS